jgi:hypothetical protein
MVPARFACCIERLKGQVKSRSVRGYTVGVRALLRAMCPDAGWSHMTMPSGGGYKSFSSVSAS